MVENIDENHGEVFRQLVEDEIIVRS